MSLQTLEFKTKFNAPAATVFAWHQLPGAFERLAPPWVDMKVLARTGGINGGTVTLLIHQGPAFIKWDLAHDPKQFIEGVQFRDYQVKGPFKSWSQIHRVESCDETSCYLIDRVEFELPDVVPAMFIAQGYIQGELKRLFAYRHKLIAQDLAQSAQLAGGKKMKVLVSGSHGLIGSALVSLLTTNGHEVTRLVRAQSQNHANGAGANDTLTWDPAKQRLDLEKLSQFDGVIHLAGDSIACRWSTQKKAELRDSRVQPTKFLAQSLAKLEKKPKAFICASAIGYYGSRGGENLNESSPKGSGFLADLCEEWELATKPASDAGIRTVLLRTGIVLSPAGGALKQMLLPFELGAGGIIGDGNQYYSWITLDDECGAIRYALETDSLSGPVNLTAPHPVTNKEFTKILGSVLFRPTLIPVPTFGLHMLFGEMADELLIAGQKVIPQKLETSGYKYRFTELEPALRHVLGK